MLRIVVVESSGQPETHELDNGVVSLKAIVGDFASERFPVRNYSILKRNETNLIGYYKDAIIYIPLDNRKPDGNRIIIEMNKEYYLATGDQSAIDSIRALSLKMK